MAARITGLRYKAQPIFAQPPPHYRPLQAGGGHWKYIPSGGGNVYVTGYGTIEDQYLEQLLDQGLITEDEERSGTYSADPTSQKAIQTVVEKEEVVEKEVVVAKEEEGGGDGGEAASSLETGAPTSKSIEGNVKGKLSAYKLATSKFVAAVLKHLADFAGGGESELQAVGEAIASLRTLDQGIDEFSSQIKDNIDALVSETRMSGEATSAAALARAQEEAAAEAAAAAAEAEAVKARELAAASGLKEQELAAAVKAAEAERVRIAEAVEAEKAGIKGVAAAAAATAAQEAEEAERRMADQKSGVKALADLLRQYQP